MVPWSIPIAILGNAACPVCGASSAQVHGFHLRTVADVPVDGRRVVIRLRVRRLVCPGLPPRWWTRSVDHAASMS
ncbi:transposase family protein, partial [Streptomyces sp. 1222.5]|uniref:transposase family protein n=1 Tax=Streptomyces sp. 1222.5 TaxID=1881026 RepID=UPI003EB7D3A8